MVIVGTIRLKTFIAIGTLSALVISAFGSVLYSRHVKMAAAYTPIVGTIVAGDKAALFDLQTTAGPLEMAEVRGPILLEIFATWCPHCQRETKVVDRLYSQYGRRVAIVGVSGHSLAADESSDESLADILAFKSKFAVTYPLAFDPSLGVAKKYLKGGYPTFVLIDRRKRVAYLDSGELPYDKLSRAIIKALK